MLQSGLNPLQRRLFTCFSLFSSGAPAGIHACLGQERTDMIKQVLGGSVFVCQQYGTAILLHSYQEGGDTHAVPYSQGVCNCRGVLFEISVKMSAFPRQPQIEVHGINEERPLGEKGGVERVAGDVHNGGLYLAEFFSGHDYTLPKELIKDPSFENP